MLSASETTMPTLLDVPNGHLLPCAAPRPLRDLRGRGVVAVRPILRGDVIAIFGGSVLSEEALLALGPEARRRALQVEEDYYLYSDREGPADWINHSCDPNAGLSGQIVLVALRAIAKGEEIAFDYAMSDGSAYDEFECACGSPRCRKFVRGTDWRRPDLQRRYAGHFSPYLQRRIDASHAAAAPFARTKRHR